MNNEWQMLFGSEIPYWTEKNESLVQPSPLEVVEDTTSNGASNYEQVQVTMNNSRDKMKYKAGDKVTHFTGINGMITKVLLDTNAYWFVFLKDMELMRFEIDECEIEGYTEDNKIGFCKK